MHARVGLSVIVLLAVLVAACGDSGGTAPAASATPTAPAVPASPDGGGSPTAEPTREPSLAPSDVPFDPAAVSLAFEVVVDGLESPLAVTHSGDGSGRLFVAERGGPVRIVAGGALLAEPLLDIADRVQAGGEQGLLGLAFHPDFPEDPRFFVNYTDRTGTTIVSSFTVGADPDRADPASEVEILRIGQPYANHNGGALAFGPDGFLYVATGDGGSGGDPHDNGQRLDTLLGKVLRIDVDEAGDGRAYAVPPDNPFVGDGDAEPEIWLTGLRNPWRMSFDRATGDLWIGDVGQRSWEEVDVARAGRGGLNFGWNRMEGDECYQDAGCEDPDFTPPVAVYGHDRGCSVIGGVVYRGTAVPSLAGGYVFADYCSGNVWVLDPVVEGPTDIRLVMESGRALSSIGEDEAGEPYATDLVGGELLRIVSGG